MIRKFENKELEQVMQIWLTTNLQAHDFIAKNYWSYKNYQAVKEALPEAKIYVAYKDEQLQGFIGLQGNYLAGLFVAPPYQGQGVGKKLLSQAKKDCATLVLHVYQKNCLALNFYLHQGFSKVSQRCDEVTGEIEYELVWRRENGIC